jgi:site-specific recombinase XerD
LFKQIGDFAERWGLRYLKELDLPMLDEFRSEWKDGPRSSLKKLERLRAFLRFCERRKWIHDNPALDLKAPKIQDRPTMPFTQAEMLKILAAFDTYRKRAGVANAQRPKAFIMLLRYSGMRIRDTVKCGVDRISGGKLFLYTRKTRCRCIACFRTSWCGNWRRPLSRAKVISFGQENPSCIAPSGSGNEGCKLCLPWLRLTAGMHIGSGIPSP